MAEFSVKSFTLSVYVKRVFEACSQVCYVTEVRLSHGSSSVMKTLTFASLSLWPKHRLQTTTLTHAKQSCTGTTRSDRLFLVWVPRLWYAPASEARLLRGNFPSDFDVILVNQLTAHCAHWHVLSALFQTLFHDIKAFALMHLFQNISKIRYSKIQCP